MRRVDTQDLEALRSLVGSTIEGRYRLDAVIALGGMGAVFRARQLSLDKDLAVKVLHPNLAADQQAFRRFEREAEAASRLDHHNCVRIHDYGHTQLGMAYMAMELLEGAELTNLLGMPLAPETAVDLICQVLEGLGHAHGRGVVHRDVKPENVIAVAGGGGPATLKLVDFGIAKLLEHSETRAKLTRTGFVFGTPRYMSPEQARGESLDGRADLYAAGLILYEMLTGWPPFRSVDVGTLLRNQVEAIHDPLPQQTPAALRSVVDRLLKKSPADRYQSADEALDALGKIRASLQGVEPAPKVAPKAAPKVAPPSHPFGSSGAENGVPEVSLEDDLTVPAEVALPAVSPVPPASSAAGPAVSRRSSGGWGVPALVSVAGFLAVGSWLMQGPADPEDVYQPEEPTAKPTAKPDPKPDAPAPSPEEEPESPTNLAPAHTRPDLGTGAMAPEPEPEPEPAPAADPGGALTGAARTRVPGRAGRRRPTVDR